MRSTHPHPGSGTFRRSMAGWSCGCGAPCTPCLFGAMLRWKRLVSWTALLLIVRGLLRLVRGRLRISIKPHAYDQHSTASRCAFALDSSFLLSIPQFPSLPSQYISHIMSDGDHSSSSDSNAGRSRRATGRPNGASNGTTNGTHPAAAASAATQPPVVSAGTYTNGGGTYTNGGTSRTNGGGISDSSSSSGQSHARTHTLPPPATQAVALPPEPRRVATEDLYYNLHGLPPRGAPPPSGYGSQFGSPQGSPYGGSPTRVHGSPQSSASGGAMPPLGSPFGGSPTRVHGSPQSSASGGAMPPPGSPLGSPSRHSRSGASSASGVSAMALSQFGYNSPHSSLDSARPSSGVQSPSNFPVPSVDQAALNQWQAAREAHARTGSLPVQPSPRQYELPDSDKRASYDMTRDGRPRRSDRR
ncbi:hypothetical protein FKP32DRAFT_1368537 [Trametes sanguinea]|nr:hypothetical protein FKP32DRAFT_1368537 [Trametes sanguinea]